MDTLRSTFSRARYINPFTDFGFKRLFGEEFNKDQFVNYEESLKQYRDLKNSLDTAFDDGKIEGKIEGRVEGEQIGIAKGKAEGVFEIGMEMLREGISIDMVHKITKIPIAKLSEFKNSL